MPSRSPAANVYTPGLRQVSRDQYSRKRAPSTNSTRDHARSIHCTAGNLLPLDAGSHTSGAHADRREKRRISLRVAAALFLLASSIGALSLRWTAERRRESRKSAGYLALTDAVHAADQAALIAARPDRHLIVVSETSCRRQKARCKATLFHVRRPATKETRAYTKDRRRRRAFRCGRPIGATDRNTRRQASFV